MNDTILVLGVLGVAIGGLVLVASRLDRRAKTEGALLTGKPTLGGKILAFLLGSVLLAFALFSMRNGLISIMGVFSIALGGALIAYSFGFYSLFQRR
jgi:uncharacterized membrane protein